MNQIDQSSADLRPLTQALVTVCIVISLGLICAGIYELNSLTENTSRPYLLMTVGSCALALLPRKARLAPSPIILMSVLALAIVACGLTQTRVVELLRSKNSIPWEVFSYQWSLSMGFFVLIFAAWQLLRKRPTTRMEPVDTWLACSIFLVALALRSWNVVTRSPIAIEDEFQHFSAILSPGGYININPLGTLNSFPCFYYWAVSYLYRPFYAVVDLFVFQKLLVAVAGAASISLWYLIIRLFHSRSVALVFASLLSFLGWHWLNSRLLYCYPYDLAFVAAGCLCALLSLRARSVFYAMLAGLFCALTLVFQKSGVLVCPLIAYIFLDALVRSDKERRREILLYGMVWGISIAFFYMPFIMFAVSPNNPEGLLPRQSGILANRSDELARAGVGQLEAIRRMVADVFLQLQYLEYDHVRHLFRINGPILDPVLSGLFFLGLVKVIFSSVKDAGSRLCLIGFALFTLPMIISFPVDSGLGHGLSRRFLCSAPFVTWMAALGASLLVKRTLPERLHTRALIILCCASAYGNFFYLMKDYLGPKNPLDITIHKDLAIQRSSSTLLLRSLAKSGFRVVYYWDSRPQANALTTKDLRNATRDLPNIVHASSIEDLRSQLSAGTSAPQFVVIPASTGIMDKFYQDLPAQLSDLVPSYLWMPGSTDTHMVPTSWYAFVRTTN